MTALERCKRFLLKKAWSNRNNKPPVTRKPLFKRRRSSSKMFHETSKNKKGRFGRHRQELKNFLYKRKSSGFDEPLELLEINLATYRLMKAEVLHRISQGNGRSCTLFDAIEAIKSSNEIMYSHAHDPNEVLGRAFWNLCRKDNDRFTKRKYMLMFALDDIEARPSACDDRVGSWEEVEEALREHMTFPEESFADQEENLSEDPVERLVQRIDLDYRAKIDERLAESQSRLQEIVQTPLSTKLALDKAHKGVSERFEEEAQQREEFLSSSELRFSEERLLLEEREAEAQERASQLLRDLTPEEQQLVQNALFDIGPEDEVVAKCDTDFVTRKNMHTLQPGAWVSDEIIHFFLAMLAKRDEELCQEDPTRKRSHFFKSFFMTKLINDGHNDPAIAGTYEYKNVKRWSKKVPGKDIFQLDKIIFPINVGEVHWVCAVAFMQEKRIQYYDSFVSSRVSVFLL